MCNIIFIWVKRIILNIILLLSLILDCGHMHHSLKLYFPNINEIMKFLYIRALWTVLQKQGRSEG